MGKKRVNLQIWCSEETRDRFKIFVVLNKCRSYEEALIKLLDSYEAERQAVRILS